ncbi:MAG: hypothetical protein KJO50_00430, partial [Bacteroidia bacterium]|nr:hypothetical protein [Bacteroidia bacterium]
MTRNLTSVILIMFLQLNLTAQFTIIVNEIPGNTPPADEIFIAGDFQGWDPGNPEYKLSQNDETGYYHITLPITAGDIQFKFARGDWSRVETDANGQFIPNRFYAPYDGDTIYLQILGWEDLDGNGGGESTAADNVHILTDSFYMTSLDRYRRVWIYLPPDYDATNHNYPVLYMHDGQNVFDALTSYIGEWEVDETLNRLYEEGDPGIIVVAVDNGQNLRTEEYTPWPHPTYGGGKGESYIDFIVNDLKPYIDNNYRTLSDRENTGIMGSSLGGLISTYAGIEYQEIFSKIGAFSPAYWFNAQSYTHVINTGKKEDMRIYQIAGTLEGAQYIDNMFEMHGTFLASGFGENEVITIEKSDGQHSEWFWAREFAEAYKWLFRHNTTEVTEAREEIRNINAFPNPVTDFLNLEFYLAKATELRIELIDTTGRNTRHIYS